MVTDGNKFSWRGKHAVAPKYCILDSFLIIRSTPFLLWDSCHTVVDIMVI